MIIHNFGILQYIFFYRGNKIQIYILFYIFTSKLLLSEAEKKSQ